MGGLQKHCGSPARKETVVATGAWIVFAALATGLILAAFRIVFEAIAGRSR
jgi:hypothetical protein